MANISDMTTMVAPDVFGCPTNKIESALLLSAIEFCKKSKFWRYEHDPITVVNKIADYELSLPDDSQIESIEDPALIGQRKVYQKNRHWLNTEYDSNWESLSGDSDYILVTEPWKLKLIPKPSSNVINGLKIHLILKPTLTATTIPDSIYNDYAEVIAHGARWRLMMEPKKSWSDPSLADYHAGLFMAGISEAESKSKSGFKSENRNRRIKAHFF